MAAIGVSESSPSSMAENAAPSAPYSVAYSSTMNSTSRMFFRCLTTTLFLAPLVLLDFVWPGIRTLVVAVGLLLVISLSLSLAFLPVLAGPPPQEQRLAPWIRRLVARFVRVSVRRPWLVLGTSVALVVGAMGVALGMGVRGGDPVERREGCHVPGGLAPGRA